MAAPIAEGKVVGIVGGFEQFVPISKAEKFEVLGDDMQILNIRLDPGEKLTTESGSMNFMSPNVEPGVDCNDCVGRCCSGESCIMSTYTGVAEGDYIAVTPNLPAKVIPVDVATTGALRAKNGAYFASLGDASVDYKLDCNPSTCCCSGQGCVHQYIRGTTGTAFLSAMGTILQKNLEAGEVMVIDTNSLVAWQETTELGVKLAGGCCVCCCGGEGLFNTTVKGPGMVYVQSMSVQKFKQALMVQAEQKQNEAAGLAGGAPPSPDTIQRD